MGHVTYETDSDISNEQRVCRYLESQGIGVDTIKRYYPCDFLLNWDGTQYLAEYKRRNFLSTKYPTFIIPALKYATLKNLSQALGIPVLFLMEYDDGLYYRLMPVDPVVKFGGRQDRGKDEREPMVEVPLCTALFLADIKLHNQNKRTQGDN